MAVNWGSTAWWIVVALSVPFSVYASLFLYGDFDLYKKATVAWAGKRYDIAGLHILHNLRAWQVHVVGAFAFLFTAPFQFSPSFRKNHLAIHRRMGYIFVAAAVETSLSALFVLTPKTEFGSIAKFVFVVASICQLSCVVIAVQAARDKQIQRHRRFMIRTAAIGYGVVNSRIFPPFLHSAGVEFYAGFEYGHALAFSVNMVLAELYIWRFLSSSRVPLAGNCTQTSQCHSHRPWYPIASNDSFDVQYEKKNLQNKKQAFN